jgi:hypothetical protein
MDETVFAMINLLHLSDGWGQMFLSLSCFSGRRWSASPNFFIDQDLLSLPKKAEQILRSLVGLRQHRDARLLQD